MSLVRSGVLVSHTNLINAVGHKGLRKIKSIFSILTIGHNNIRKTACSFKIIKHTNDKNISEKHVLIPRFGGFMLQKTGILSSITNKLQIGENIRIGSFDAILTPNQLTVLDYLKNNIYTS